MTHTSSSPSGPEPGGANFGVPRPGTRYKMTAWRVICGSCWALWTALFAIGAISELANGKFSTFLAAAVLAGLAGWYDYRIWSLKARRLTLLIIF